MSEKIKLEICLDSADSAAHARDGGADRVELCDNLFGGGTTPSIGLVRVVRRTINIGLQVIIRPRGGDFCYTDREFDVMMEDTLRCREEGVDGIVIGILHPDGRVDRERCARLIEAAGPMNVTFHRAFDVARDPFEALETVISLGCTRILTSGQEGSVLEGADLIRALIEQAGDRMIIMPGGDITERNLEKIRSQTGAREYHIHLDAEQNSPMEHRPGHVYMGGLLRKPEFLNSYTSTDRVRTVRGKL